MYVYSYKLYPMQYIACKQKQDYENANPYTTYSLGGHVKLQQRLLLLFPNTETVWCLCKKIQTFLPDLTIFGHRPSLLSQHSIV